MLEAVFSVINAITTVLSQTIGGGGPSALPTSPPKQYETSYSCYNPELNMTLNLTWPDNFTSLTDYRKTLSPQNFPNVSETFSTEDACYPMILKDTDAVQQSSRTYIRVRRNVRISSCKTDELEGPYNIEGGHCPDWRDKGGGENAYRGTCTVTGYPDLRKIAEVVIDGDVKEIFWTPFSHNVGCDYDPAQPNCGHDPETDNPNLREFVYVLNKRDAFDLNDPRRNCKVRWDAGSTDKGACSHYFDVYMARDLYEKLQHSIPQDDPDFKTYEFIKQVVEHCQEQTTFSPIVEVPGAALYPPQFIAYPFVENTSGAGEPGKINPQTAEEAENYKYFVLSTPVINPSTTSLLKLSTQNNILVNVCPSSPFYSPSSSPSPTPGAATSPTPTPSPTQQQLSDCYLSIGIITFDNGQTFKVYSREDTPQTFYLSEENAANPVVYHYTITDVTPPAVESHLPSLQLAALEISAENTWTWATPRCKPALYLYPEKPSRLTVKVNIPKGRITISDPPYDPENGWTVKAFPDGTLVSSDEDTSEVALSEVEGNSSDGGGINQTYHYLYYEAEIFDANIPKEGFIWPQNEIQEKVGNVLSSIGFNEKEIADFHQYWLPRLHDKPYYFVTLVPEETINSEEPLWFSRNPDTLIRTRVVFEGLDFPLSVRPLTNLPRHERQGFVVADWGGTLIGKSCRNISVK